MAQRSVFVQSALLPRLLAAIGAGSLLAAPGCGGKTQSANGAVSDGVDGVEQTSEESSAAANTTTKPGATTASPNNPPSTPPTATPPDGTTDNTQAPPTQPVTSSTLGETTDWATELTASTATSEHTTLPQTSTESPEVTSIEPPIDAGAPQVMCEFGTAQQFCLTVDQMESQARVGVGEIPIDPPRSDDAIAAAWDANGCMKHEWIATGCCNPAVGPGEPGEDGSCCYVACEGACCGRPFVVNGAALMANVVAGTSWLIPGDSPESRSVNVVLDTRARRLLGAAWLEDARMEHASIASFAQFSVDLLRLGAPPELLRDSHAAGLDEIEHARIAFTIAEQFSGVAVGPDEWCLGRLDVHSAHDAIAAAIIEGCIGETLASGVLAEQAQHCSDPQIASHLRRIAEDELRHAELAWRFVAWSLQRYGASARKTVEATFATAFAKLPTPPTALGLSEAELQAGGRISPSVWARVVESLMTTVLEPAAATLLAADSQTFARARSSAVGAPATVSGA